MPTPESIDLGALVELRSFTASRSSIRAGETSTLSWRVAFPHGDTVGNATLTLQLNGAVVERSGSETVSPAVSTTYVLVVGVTDTGGVEPVELGRMRVRVRGHEVYVRCFGHFENVLDPDTAAAAVADLIDVAVAEDVPIEANFHRAEWQAEHYPDPATGLGRRLDSELVTIAYHPHPLRPYADWVLGDQAGPADAESCYSPTEDRPSIAGHVARPYLPHQRWNEAIETFTALERGRLDFQTGALDREASGGLPRMLELVDRRGTGARSVCLSGAPDAISCYVYGRVFGIPSVLFTDSCPLGPRDGEEFFLGAAVQLFWFMGQLVIRHIDELKLTPHSMTAADVEGTIAAARGFDERQSHPIIVSLLASDKGEGYSQNEYAFDLYRPGVSTRASLWSDFRRTTCHEGANGSSRYRNRFQDIIREVARLGIPFVSTDELLEDLVEPLAVTLGRRDLDAAVAELLAAWTDRPPLQVEVGEIRLSMADLYEALARALIAFRRDQSLPDTLEVTGTMLGPHGAPIAGSMPTHGATARVDLSTTMLLDHLVARGVGTFVPMWTDPSGFTSTTSPTQDQLGAAELLWTMATIYRGVTDGGVPPFWVARPGTPPFPVPDGVPRAYVRVVLDTARDRVTWSTWLQCWSLRRATWA